MKKFLAIALALLMIIATFASCGSTPDIVGESESQSDQIVQTPTGQTPTTDNGADNGATEGEADGSTEGEGEGESDGEGEAVDTCDHQEETPATCTAQSVCSVCKKPYGEKDAGNHSSTETKWVTTETTHKKVHSCCEAVVNGFDETAHDFSSGACVCGATQSACAHESTTELGHSCKTCNAFLKHTFENNTCKVCGLKLAKASVSAGDVIYFGSYPQSAASGSFTAGEWVKDNNVWYTDITSGSDKYRGIKTSQNGSVSWFKYDPIKWDVLAVDGNKALILSNLVIDSQAFQKNVTYTDPDNNKLHAYITGGDADTHANNYELSTIRNWLITTFYTKAFNDLQKDVIATINVENDDNVVGDYKTNGNKFFCSDTEDKIFLLSKGEVKQYSTFDDNSERVKYTSAYAKKVITANGYDPSSGAWWWLRTPTYSSTIKYDDAYVSTTEKCDRAHSIRGTAHSDGRVAGQIDSYQVHLITGGVVPAMWVYING